MSTVSNVSNNAASSVSGAAGYQPASAPSGNVVGEVEQLLQDVENLMQQASQSAGQTAGTQSTPQASTAQPTSGGMPTTGSTGSNAMNGQSASGALAAYMGTNGDQSLNMNDLYKLSQGQAAGGSGQTPSPEVQQAAQYMLANPGVYNKIETNDVAGADGISGAANFQNAAEGNIPGVTAGASQTAGTQSTPQASTAQPTSGGMPTSGTPETSAEAATKFAGMSKIYDALSKVEAMASGTTSGTPASGTQAGSPTPAASDPNAGTGASGTTPVNLDLPGQSAPVQLLAGQPDASGTKQLYATDGHHRGSVDANGTVTFDNADAAKWVVGDSGMSQGLATANGSGGYTLTAGQFSEGDLPNT